MRLVKLSKTYAGGTQALAELSVEMRRGEICCLLGQNGREERAVARLQVLLSVSVSY